MKNLKKLTELIAIAVRLTSSENKKGAERLLFFCMLENTMHNLLSNNMLNEWKHFGRNTDEIDSKKDLIDDYFECLIECDDNQAECKRTCRYIL